MTIKEIATTAGCGLNTVKRWVSANMPTKMVKGKVTRFTWDEAHRVMEALPKRNLVSHLGQQLSPNGLGSAPVQIDPSLQAVIAGIVSAVIANLDGRVSIIEKKVADRAALLPAPQVKPRDHINQLVRKYADANGMAFSSAWGDLYREFGYRTNTAPKVAAKNRGMGILDYIEAEGLLETLEAVAMEWAR